MNISKQDHCNHSSNWRRAFNRVAPLAVAASLFLVAFGALATAQYQDRFHDRDDRDYDRVPLRVSHQQVAVDFGGGHGGRPSPDAMCNEQALAVGFHVQTGEYYNQAWLDCAHVRHEGGLGDDIRMTERTGSPGGRPVHDAYCRRGFVLRGLVGRTGASIDEAVGMCSPLREIARRFDNPHTEMTQSVTRPYPGGRPTQAVCPAGSAVTGFRSNSGEYMDHLWLLCSEVHREHDRD